MKKMQHDERNAAPCRYCLRKSKKLVYPKIVEVDGLFYARCPECNRYDPYDFLGLSEKKAINTWNDCMEGYCFYGISDED